MITKVTPFKGAGTDWRMGLATPPRPADDTTEEFCLLQMEPVSHGDVPEVYFPAGMLTKPIKITWGFDTHLQAPIICPESRSRVALFRNCLNGYWEKVFDGRLNELWDIALAAQGR